MTDRHPGAFARPHRPVWLTLVLVVAATLVAALPAGAASTGGGKPSRTGKAGGAAKHTGGKVSKRSGKVRRAAKRRSARARKHAAARRRQPGRPNAGTGAVPTAAFSAPPATPAPAAKSVVQRAGLAVGSTAPVPTAKPVPPSTPPSSSGPSSGFGFATNGGMHDYDAATLDRDFDMMAAARGGWIRFDINWAVIQRDGPTSYDWSTFDRMAKAASARGMRVLGVLNYTPSWARPAGTEATYRPDPAKFAAFARTAVEHYSALGVHAYEVWNEPNIKPAFKPAPSVADYAGMLKAASPAIKAADPSATVVTGGMSPAGSNGTDISPADFLAGLYRAGAKGAFDAVGHHPYCWSYDDRPGAKLDWSAWYQMYGTKSNLRGVMAANGDSAKRVWATEVGAPTNGQSSDSPVTEARQAAYVSEVVSTWRSYDWSGPMFWYSARDHGTDTSTREDFFGLIRNDFTPKPAYRAWSEAVGA